MMILERMNEQYKRITNAIMDEESKKIFDSRIEYMITRNEERFEEALFDEKKIIIVWKLIQYYREVG